MDIITHVTKLDRFREEAMAQAKDNNAATDNLFALDEDGGLIYNANKVPVVYSGNESLCLIRVKNDSALRHLKYLKRLGECINNEYVFDTDAAKETYERIHDTTTRTITNESGETFEFTSAYKIGVFA